MAAGAETVRVLIVDGKKSVAIQGRGGLIVNGKGTNPSLTVIAAAMSAEPLRVSSAGTTILLDKRSYRGTLEVRKKNASSLQVINELDIEDYLKGVVAAEIPYEWHAETLKAQAVASRTYALYQKRRSGRRFYDLLATVNSQMYLGVRGERPSAVAAVEATRGEVLRYNGWLIAAYYHSSCGGHTEDARELWGIDEPYLHGVDCDCQRISKYGLWEKHFTLRTLLPALGRKGYDVGNIVSVEPGEITPAGRVKRVLFRSDLGTVSVPSDVLRSSLGYAEVPSLFFEPEFVGGEFVLSGRGLGHGVGLCQWGALEMALRGSNYRAILRYYYPGAQIRSAE